MSSSNVDPFSVFFFFLGEQCNMEVELNICMKTILLIYLCLIRPNILALSKSNSPRRHIALRSLPLGMVISITFPDDRCQSSLVCFNVCVFSGRGRSLVVFLTPLLDPWAPRHPGGCRSGASGWVCYTWGTRCGSPATWAGTWRDETWAKCLLVCFYWLLVAEAHPQHILWRWHIAQICFNYWSITGR